jgi:hypothetical protein
MRLPAFVVLCCALAVSRSGRADTTTIESHGLELEMPSDWVRSENNNATLLAPKTFRGRAIQIISLPSMPTDKASLAKLVTDDDDGAPITKAKFEERNGVRMMIAEAHMTHDGVDYEFDMDVVPVGNAATLVLASVKSDSDPVVRKANQDVLMSPRLADFKMSVTVDKAASGKGIPQDFVDSIELTAMMLDLTYTLPRPLPVYIKDCGRINAFYSPTEHTITLCHELFDWSRALFEKNNESNPEQLAVQWMQFVFYHEFGHALEFEFQLDTTGKSEDVADEVASLSLIADGEDGQHAVTAAARMFKLMAKAGGKPTTQDFYGSHSYDEMRVGNLVCQLYGADKEAYGDLANTLGMPRERLYWCAEQYPKRQATWDKLLAPHKKHYKGGVTK